MPEDVAWMWTDPPTAHASAEHRVYFSAYATQAPSGANPNVAALGSRLEPAGALEWRALLGVWRDCNGDGYVGLAETGALRYPSALLEPRETTTCPARDSGPHNDGAWVHEVLWLAPGHAEPRAGVMPIEGTVVWGDVGGPGAAGFESCPLHPLPRGATSNTGLLMRHADCATQHRFFGAINSVDNDDGLGLAIEDPDRPQDSDSHLVREMPAHPFDNPRNGQPGLVAANSSAPAFTVWDCESAGGSRLAPTLADDPLARSWWEGAERAGDGAVGDCDPATASPLRAVHPHAFIEAPGEPTSHAGRDRNDVVFTFRATGAPRAPGAWALDPWRMSAAGPAGVDEEFGWVGENVFVGPPRLVDRGTLQPEGARMWTFHARLGAAALDMGVLVPASQPGTYAAEACLFIGPGARDRAGWVCDHERWWRDAAGDARPRDVDGAALGAVPGDAYHLRDVDCFDGSAARAAPVGATLAWLSERGPCGAP